MGQSEGRVLGRAQTWAVVLRPLTLDAGLTTYHTIPSPT
ncbi:hypothetical protein Hypma_012512 [Hypsizygus marmoreus]|uniref:Uncharacterized protein n=1 Tax=Hypsizygus marmoreus TaxID=39966 RepID=A0A369JL24_HYPMA|nr:hypothetical protein Hypma_012512 [Hypsizygus marmoreus]